MRRTNPQIASFLQIRRSFLASHRSDRYTKPVLHPHFMNTSEIKALLADWTEEDEDDEPIFLSRSELECLDLADFANGARVQVGDLKDGTRHIELDGYITKGTGTPLQLEIHESYYRKFWEAPVGMWHYLDMVRRAIETRQRTRGDVVFCDFDNSDDPWVHLSYTILLDEKDVSKAYASGLRINQQLFEAAEHVTSSVDQMLAKEAQKVSGWGAFPLQTLVDQVEGQATSDAKGRVLEELACRLFETIPGFQVAGRVRTTTEEIDIRVTNNSDDAIWKREGSIIVAECKNWSSKVGKDEFVLFKEKVSNRRQRCSCGFLISWNGFADTVTKELLRGSREEAFIIPVSGADLRAAVLAETFEAIARKLWESVAFL